MFFQKSARTDAPRSNGSRHKRLSVKDVIAQAWGEKISPGNQDRIAWSVLSTLVSGLQETLLPLNDLKGAIASENVEEFYSVIESFDPQMYVEPALLLQDRIIVDLFSKLNWVSSPFNKRERAKLRFWEAEEMCKRTNSRLFASSGSADVEGVIHHARNIIQSCLGTFCPTEMLDHSRFGPGATLCVTGNHTTPYFKLSCIEPTVGTCAFPYAEALLNHDRKWLAYLSGMHPLDVAGRFNLVSDEVAPELRLSDHNKVTFVPKNAKTDRSIAIEPYFNLYFQLGVGGMIRKRLHRRLGQNLNSQKRNQDLARIGSVDGSLATIDLSMASDTLSRGAVELLVPQEWFFHLENLRSKSFVLDGKTHQYHKFSSMGNGFTFELESLIFLAVSRACCMRMNVSYDQVSVYGDDIIIPTHVYPLLCEALEYLGFKTNVAKSFHTGRFRESCGADYFEGHNVRPIFCKEICRPSDVVSLANRLSALNRTVGLSNWHFGWLDRARDFIVDQFIPVAVKKHLVGPPTELVDGYLHVENPIEVRSSLVRWNRHLFRWEHPVMLFQPSIYNRSGAAAALFMHAQLRPDNYEPFSFGRNVGTPVQISARNLGRMKLRYWPWDGLHGGTLRG